MNTFNSKMEHLSLNDVKEMTTVFDHLPGTPPFLSKKECALILNVSLKVINHLTENGQLPITRIPGDILDNHDLFGSSQKTHTEECILRSDLLTFMEKSLLCNKPVNIPPLDENKVH